MTRIAMCEFHSLAAESRARHLQSVQISSRSWVASKSIHVWSRRIGMSDDGDRAYRPPLPSKLRRTIFEDSGTGGFWSERDSRRGSMIALDLLGESVCRVTFVHLDATGDCDAPARSAIWAAVKPGRASMLICAALAHAGGSWSGRHVHAAPLAVAT